MARVFIDCHMFSQEWFKTVLKELVDKDSVMFVYGGSSRLANELARVRDALRFFKLVGDLRRRIDADVIEIERHIRIIEADKNYKTCQECDDSHIFSIIYVKPTPYVFSMDARMARCRDKINKTLDKRYCNFIVISDVDVYNCHKVHILS